MSATLHLSIATPSVKLIDIADARMVRAEDESGSFGIMPGHADFLTVLSPSVVRWKDGAGTMHFCAVDGGILTVDQGRNVAIACRQGKLGDDIDQLRAAVVEMRAEIVDTGRRSRVEQMRLHANAVRHLMRLIRSEGTVADAPSRKGPEQ